MKSIILLFVVFTLCFSACDSTVKKIHDKNTAHSDSILFIAAKELKGVGEFLIDKSTYSDVLNVLKNQDEGFSIREFKYDTLKSNLVVGTVSNENTFGCPKIKRIEKFEYSIGNIKLSDLHFSFYNDTLYEITCNYSEQVEKGFISKYGQGNFIDLSSKKINGDVKKVDIIRVWENENLKAESRLLIEYQEHGHMVDYFKISTKNHHIHDEVLKCSNHAFELERQYHEKSKQADYNKL